ncbi:nucleic-acid-binding protein [Achromatium sp. WMS3]|nr:nucleic-acid-binding protein [Achromatium sp. WMS3]
MSSRFIDTNVVIYTFAQDEIKQNIAIDLLATRPVSLVQVLSETANIMKKKLGFDNSSIRSIVARIASECATILPISLATLQYGLELSDRYGFSHFDNLIVASALEAGCTELYSEDMHHRLVVDKRLTIINPFQ